jgi:hypothetical protein
MIAMRKSLLGLLLLVLAAAMASGCGETRESPREERGVKVGGDHGVVVEHSDYGTQVKVGGDHGIVVNHPRDRAEDDER